MVHNLGIGRVDKNHMKRKLGSTDVVGSSFDDYVAEVEADLDKTGQEMLHAFRSHYTLANQLIELRKRQKMTQQQLAKLAGVHQSEVSRIERGAANASQSALERIARVFGTSLGFVPTGAKRPRAAA